MMKTTNRSQARLRLVVNNDRKSDGGYKSGRSSWRGTPETASAVSTRSEGTRPERRHFCTAWYDTPHLDENGKSPPPPSIARSTGFMPDNLQLPVAIRQQPRDVWLFLTMQPMVEAEIERTRFAKALNERVAREHPEVRGRPGWLRDRIKSYVKQQKNSRFKAVSEQTCAYWLKGEKIARHANATMLCEALGLTRGDLFGESEDPRLAAIVERWAKLPEHVKNGIHSMVNPEAFQPSEPSQATSAPQRPSLRVARP